MYHKRGWVKWIIALISLYYNHRISFIGNFFKHIKQVLAQKLTNFNAIDLKSSENLWISMNINSYWVYYIITDRSTLLQTIKIDNRWVQCLLIPFQVNKISY